MIALTNFTSQHFEELMGHVAGIDAVYGAHTSAIEHLLRNSDVLRNLILTDTGKTHGHAGEEGRWTEALLTEFLRKELPRDLEVSTGFVVDPARGERSYQVDIIVHDSSKTAPLLRYGEAVVVAPAAVVAAISVKSTLRQSDLKKELRELADVGRICGGRPCELSPYLALVGFGFEFRGSGDWKKSRLEKFHRSIAQQFNSVYDSRRAETGSLAANEVVNSVISLSGYLLHAKGRKAGADLQKHPRAKVDLRWCGLNGDQRFALASEIICGIVEHWPSAGASASRRWARPAGLNMGSAGAIPIVCENRPPR